eukprot:TRINITY_DN9030_c0_g1_i1.p2 TRINITY_DN9030_c0_g1~~TRINITY_DN9030_c0_g1_i1.p2  ORF type:complete len:164 (+),score=28.72 TRINITY_DN9030_c0_g1_i1:444-935(+)
MRQQMRNQQMQMQEPHVVQPFGYPLNQPAAYPQQNFGAQPVQMARPAACPRPMQRPFPQERQQPAPQYNQVRGRPHDSIVREASPQPQNQYVEAQIRFHENELMRLKGMMRREEPQEMRREIPMNTCESIETNQPLRRKAIPVGQPLYDKDGNSSFASEYPEI